MLHKVWEYAAAVLCVCACVLRRDTIIYASVIVKHSEHSFSKCPVLNRKVVWFCLLEKTRSTDQWESRLVLMLALLLFLKFSIHPSSKHRHSCCITRDIPMFRLYSCATVSLDAYFSLLWTAPTCFSIISSFPPKRNLAHHCDKRDEWGTEPS